MINRDTNKENDRKSKDLRKELMQKNASLDYRNLNDSGMQRKHSENQQIVYEEFESKISQELESVMFKNALLDSSNESTI